MNEQKSTPTARFDIARGFPENLREAAAALYWLAFGRKLGAVVGPRGRAVLERALNPERALAAVADGEMLGLAGFHLGDSSFVDVKFGHLRSEFGLVGGALRAVPLALLDRRPGEGELLMDGIAVRPDLRGQGVGTELLRAVVGLAVASGLDSVRLDVIDTNPRARYLYEREGFVPVRTERVAFLRRWLGFSSFTTMVCDVGGGRR